MQAAPELSGRGEDLKRLKDAQTSTLSCHGYDLAGYRVGDLVITCCDKFVYRPQACVELTPVL